MKKRDIPVIEINQTNKKLYKVSKEFYWRNILYSSFVLTTTNGNYLYGYTLQILEEYDFIRLLPRHYAGLLTDFLSESAKNCISFQTKNLTVLSKNDNCYEFFHEWLLELYRIYLHSLDTPNMNLEIYLAHLLVNVEMPSAKKPKVAVSFNSDSIQCFLRQLSSNQLDIKVDCVISLLCCLSPKTIVHVLKCLMSEQQVMLHSVYTNLVVCVVHGLKTILFPFIWMCPYIPLCPLHIGEIMNSPTPLLVGIDSRYFDMYDLPDSICCVDIGSNNVLCERYSIKNQNDSFSFPKKATKCLIDRLAALRYELLAKIFTPTDFETWPRNIIKSICLNRKKLEAYAVRIQETFLCFMCTIYQGYNKFCHTLSRMPPNDYDIFASAFLKNDFIASNSSLSDFYRKITQTHMFQKFIIDRTVSSYDIDNCNANFFDEYSESLFIYSSKYIYGMNPPEIYYRQHFNQNSSNTAYCEMPSFKLSIINEKLIEWSKVQTVELDFVKSKIFDISLNAFNEHVDCLMNNNDKLNYSQLNHDSPKKYLRRNKNERINNLKNFQNIISLPKDSAHLMKCVIMNVWILCLPAYMGRIHKNYRFSFMKHVLFRLEKYLVKHKKFMDEIVFRTLIQLCGEYYEDTRLVKTILKLMKQYDIKTNMITVASFNSVISDSNNRAYDKYLFHSEKPTVDPIDSKWILLSNAFKAVVLFKRLVPCKNNFQKSNIFKQKSQKSYPYSVTLNSVKIKKEKDTCLVPLVKKKSHVFSMGNPLSFSLKMRRIKSDSDVFKKNESNWINLKMNQFSVTDDIQLRLNSTMQPEQSEIADIINNGENNCFSVANSDILKDISFTHKTDDAISLLYYKRHENIKLNHKYVEDGTKYLKYVFSKMEPSIIKKRHFSERFKCFVSIYSKSDLHYIGSKLNRNDVSSILKNKMNDTQSKIKITFKDYYSWFKSKKLFNDKEKVLADNLNDYASAKNQLVIQNESSSLNTITRVSERFQKLKKIIYDAYESTLISSDDSDNEKDVNDNSYYKVKTHSLQTKRYISKAKSLDILLDNKTNYTNFFTSHFNNIDDQFKFPEYYERLKNSVSNESIQLTSTKSRRLVRYASVPISLDDYWSTLKYKSKTNSNGKIYTCSDNTKLNFSESLFKPQENEQPLVNIEIHSTSACQNCKNLMYDEEIMDGWIIDDSNHSINCKICNKHFVPQLSIKLSVIF
ncbi:hypothetical protein A3Q56_05523 [Intoshia linei]|uniref:UDENN domain-containing protein n=1 Tax=Intoshia linei TaxID=1819745 RepID=A0A177AZ45_9BILA|nr:hypothetical protein A3Q56_05523 [Intoshia linei]